jgi:YVTN family beta-propeller protein
MAIGVNPVTNKMYVANVQSNTVSVIDGAINTTKLVTVGSGPFAADVNPVTNKIYVANHQGNTVTVIDGATNAASSPVTVDTNPEAVAVNPVTNKIYVASQANPSVTVIDGATNSPTTIALPAGTTCPCASGPTSVAVDTVLNRIYVTNDNSNTVTVIDGSTNTVTALNAGTGPNAIAVDPPIFKVYVANRGSSNVTVIDGAADFNPGTTIAGAGTLPESIAVNLVSNEVFAADNGSNDISVLFFDTFNTFISAPALNQPTSIAVNPASSQIWVANNGSNTATVFAGSHGTAQTVTVGNGPDGLTINPATNKVYVSNFTDNTISVIDATSITPVLTGTAGTPATLTAGTRPGNSVANRITNKTYVTNFNSGNVTVITEQNSQAIPLTVAITPLVNDQTVSATPTFTFTTSSAYSPNAPTPQSAYFQLDTLQGLWVAASGAHPTFTATTPTLTLGAHIIYAYATDGQSQDSEGSGAIGQIQAYYFNVMRPASSIALSSSKNPSGSGESVTFTATVTGSGGTPIGEVNFLDGTTVLGTSPLSGGQASFNTSSLTLGSHSITAAYSGDTNFDSSTSSVLTQNVLGATTTIVVSSLNPSLPSQSVTFTASVSTSSGTPTGSVTFMDGPNALATVTLSAQQASLTTSSLAQGSHAITAVYGGDANFAGSTSAVLTQVVLAATTTTVVSSVNPSALNQSVTFTASVSSVLGAPTGTVTFTDGASPLGTSTLINGQANFSTTGLALGSHSIVAAYGGDANFQTSTSSMLTQVVLGGTTTGLVSSVNPSLPNQAVTFTATVTGSGGTPSGTITFKDGANTLGTASLSAGQASFVTSSLAQGSHSITASYGGDANFQGSTSGALTQVVLSTTATNVVSSLNPSSLNQSVTFTATVSSGNGTPTGTVTFKDGTTTLGTGTVTSGQAGFSTSSLALGSHSITAVYGGDANFQGSTSAALTQAVRAPTSTAVTSNVNPSGLSEAVTFTASVSANSGTPTGTVTFKDGSSTLGTASLSGALQATFNATTLAPGSHSITAMYGGDANFGGSVSSALAQVVTSQSPDFTVATNSASATVTAGQSTTLNFTVTPNNGFISPITFSCSGQPAGVTCSFNPQTVTPNSSSAVTTVLTVSTTTSVATMNSPTEQRTAAARITGYRLWLPGTFGLAGLLLASRRKRPRQRKNNGLLLSALFLGLALAGLAGCGGSSASPTTATFNLVATSGGTSHSTSVTLTITH